MVSQNSGKTLSVEPESQNKILNSVSDVRNTDCMDIIRNAPDNFWDLAIVDPQYGIGESLRPSRRGKVKQKNGSVLYVNMVRKVKDWDLKRPEPEYFYHLQRVSHNQIIFGGNHFADLLPPSSGWIIWDKLNDKSHQSDCELAWSSFKCAARKFTFLWNGFMQGRTDNGRIAQGNKKLNEKRIHPTQKPIQLYKWLLKNYAKPGDKIIDTHLGSGSSRIAAYDMGFDFTGTEIDREYFDEQERRFKNHIVQEKLRFGDAI